MYIPVNYRVQQVVFSTKNFERSGTFAIVSKCLQINKNIATVFKRLRTENVRELLEFIFENT